MCASFSKVREQKGQKREKVKVKADVESSYNPVEYELALIDLIPISPFYLLVHNFRFEIFRALDFLQCWIAQCINKNVVYLTDYNNGHKVRQTTSYSLLPNNNHYIKAFYQ